MKTAMVHVGNFFFRFRNLVFPLIIVVLFLAKAPPMELFGSSTLARTKGMLALGIVLLGLILRSVVIGYAYIQRGGLKKRVYAKDLVTEGMFGVCRNPLYVGNMLIYSGLFLMHGDPLVIVVGIAGFLFIYQCIIHAEEAFLEGKFADGYRSYCADVPRWMLRFGRFAEATRGMDFNFKRVVAKDYSTVSAALIALLAVEIYRYLTVADPSRYAGYLAFLAISIVLAGAATALVSFLKKRGLFHEGRTV